MTTLPVLLDRRAPPADVAAHLDALDVTGRREALSSLSRDQQRLLYEGAAAQRPLVLEDFVPAGVGSLVPVAHDGANTLPLPAFGRRFVKCMARREDGSVVGWNDAPLAFLIGPGFFVLRPTVGDEQAHGGVVVDYYPSPTRPMPEGWPWLRPNWFGLQAFVYGWCHDYMRRVSDEVTIGAAFKWRRPVGSWFTLSRRGPG